MDIELKKTDWWKKNKHRILARARLKAGITQKELAEKTGIRQSVISDYEQGKHRMTLKAAIRFAKVLNITPERLMV